MQYGANFLHGERALQLFGFEMGKDSDCCQAQQFGIFKEGIPNGIILYHLTLYQSLPRNFA